MALKTREAKASYIRNLFATIAPHYDRANSVMSWGMDVAWRREAAQAVANPRGGWCLDVATGTGEVALEMAQGSHRVVGLDFCLPMVERGRAKAVLRGLRLHLILGDALALPFGDNSFHAITVAFAMRNVADIVQALTEMRRVIRPGGCLACLETTLPPSRLMAWAFRLYLWGLALLGGWMTGARAAYAYLPRSLAHFPNAQQLAAVMEEAGWQRVQVRRLNGGTMALHTAIK